MTPSGKAAPFLKVGELRELPLGSSWDNWLDRCLHEDGDVTRHSFTGREGATAGTPRGKSIALSGPNKTTLSLSLAKPLELAPSLQEIQKQTPSYKINKCSG